MHRLATPAVAGIRRGQGSVGICEACVELVGEGVAVVGHDSHHLAVLVVFVSWRYYLQSGKIEPLLADT